MLSAAVAVFLTAVRRVSNADIDDGGGAAPQDSPGFYRLCPMVTYTTNPYLHKLFTKKTSIGNEMEIYESYLFTILLRLPSLCDGFILTTTLII